MLKLQCSFVVPAPVVPTLFLALLINHLWLTNYYKLGVLCYNGACSVIGDGSGGTALFSWGVLLYTLVAKFW